MPSTCSTWSRPVRTTLPRLGGALVLIGLLAATVGPVAHADVVAVNESSWTRWSGPVTGTWPQHDPGCDRPPILSSADERWAQATTGAATATWRWQIRGLENGATYQLRPHITHCNASSTNAMYRVVAGCDAVSAWPGSGCPSFWWDPAQYAWRDFYINQNSITTDSPYYQANDKYGRPIPTITASACGCALLQLFNSGGTAIQRVAASSIDVVKTQNAPGRPSSTFEYESFSPNTPSCCSFGDNGREGSTGWRLIDGGGYPYTYPDNGVTVSEAYRAVGHTPSECHASPLCPISTATWTFHPSAGWSYHVWVYVPHAVFGCGSFGGPCWDNKVTPPVTYVLTGTDTRSTQLSQGSVLGRCVDLGSIVAGRGADGRGIVTLTLRYDFAPSAGWGAAAADAAFAVYGDARPPNC